MMCRYVVRSGGGRWNIFDAMKQKKGACGLWIVDVDVDVDCGCGL